MRFAIACSILVAAFSAQALAQDHSVISGPDDVKWGPAPAVLPKGAQAAVMAGDPSKEGLFVVRLKMPANYRIPAHNHPTAENVTVLSGSFHAGMGDRLDETKGAEMKAGGFVFIPEKMNHFAWTSAETVVEVAAMGPFAMDYVDPKDDPSK